MTSISPKKSQRTHSTISDVAMTLFEAQGFEDVTVDQIAEQLGISRRTIFRHFPTKADIVFEPISIGFRALPDGLRMEPAGRPIGEALANGLGFLVRELETRRGTLARHLKLVLASPVLRTLSRRLTDAAVFDLRCEILARIEGEDHAALTAAVWAEQLFVLAFGGRDLWLIHPEQAILPVIGQSRDAIESLLRMLPRDPDQPIGGFIGFVSE